MNQHFKYLFFGVFLLAGTFSACSNKYQAVNNTPYATNTKLLPSQTPIFLLSTKMVVLTSTPLAHAAPPEKTPESVKNTVSVSDKIPSFSSNYTNLLPGQYIAYDGGEIDVPVKIISINGQFQDTFLQGNISDVGIFTGFTRDGRILGISQYNTSGDAIYFYDLSKLTAEKIVDGCESPDWDQDEKNIVASCGTRYGYSELRIISLKNGQTFPIISCPNGYLCKEEKPVWSPDGRWIAYGHDSGSKDPNSGIYVLDASCISNSDTCQEHLIGPFLTYDEIAGGGYDLSFSPDSKYVAISSVSKASIYMIDFQKNVVRTLVPPLGLGNSVLSIAWSPDGEWLAFGLVWSDDSDGGIGVYLLSPWTGEAAFLGDKHAGDVISWFTIPYPATPGNTYIITEAGHDLNLRAEPSMAGVSLRKLQPGDGVTVLDGPVSADGYTWWKLKADDGTEGWAVNIPEWYAPMKP